jgi:hypothetical protein
MMHVISLGAGVQSSTMALMAARGEIMPMPTAAIFADTQSEPKAVYKWLDWLEAQLPFPVIRGTNGSLFNEIGKQRVRGQWRKQPLPLFIKTKSGKAALLNRSCTQDYKIKVIHREVRKLLGIYRRRSPVSPVVIQWIGISTDEATRAKDSRNAWQSNRYPLLENGISRRDCLAWMDNMGYPQPPKSSCVFCPFHSNAQWAEVQADANAWAAACEIDERVGDLFQDRGGELFLHRSLVPLRGLRFAMDTDYVPRDPDLFENECEGVCGV